MRKLFSIFTAMLAALAVSATPVVLPATLDVSNVSFRSEGMPDFVLAEGDYAGTYFDMGAHDSANDTLLYAEWDVTIEPLKYDIDVVVYNTNSWRVQLYLLNQKGDTVKDLRYKGSSGQCGKYAIGSMDLKDLEAGNYKLRARAATAWSAMKLKELIVKADYKGATVAMPGKLLPAYAELSANASVTDDAIAFKPSTAPDEYATWNVTFAKAGSFDVTIDMTASNGHNYGVALLSADGGTEIGAVNEGGQKGDTGEKALGSIAVPAAGKYIVKLTNSIQWSEAVLNSITFAAPYEPAMKTIYCKMTQDWWTKDGAAVGIYTWGDGGNKKAEWPGERMTAVEGEEGIWSFELDVNKYHMCIFTRVNASGDIADWGAKTKDLTIPTDDKDLFTITTAEAVWGDPGCEGEWSKFEEETPAGCDWDNIDWLGDGSAEQTFSSQFKVCVGDPAPTSVVNIQTSFGTETGIYVTFPSAAFGAISLPEGKYAIQGAGMLLYVSAFVAKETEVSVVCDNKEIVFTVYNAKGTDTPTAIESNVVAVKAVKMIENGQLVIIRGGEKFNAQGQLIR
ncbi:MAG: starch-binding protein [Paludibacteraceae bacterium]|nr:starch-binding protein [Paludibacteraceae bacterium]